jgi:hypothetical protein
MGNIMQSMIKNQGRRLGVIREGFGIITVMRELLEILRVTDSVLSWKSVNAQRQRFLIPTRLLSSIEAAAGIYLLLCISLAILPSSSTNAESEPSKEL